MNEAKTCPVFGLYAASRHLIKIYSVHLEEVGLTYPQYLVISCLLSADKLSVDEIGRELFLDSGTLTPLLKRLETNGFLVRGRCKIDERKRIIMLTDSGRELQNKFDVIREAIRSELHVSKEDVNLLTKILTKIISNKNLGEKNA